MHGRWYRSPELLLGARAYGYGVDIWALGCIFAELMLRTPYLAAETDIGQLQTIFRALGTPTEETWPVIFINVTEKGLSSLPDYHDFPKYTRTSLKSLFTAASDDTLDLLEKMLEYDPLRRVTTEEGLQHAYFKTSPRPTPCEKLPKSARTSVDLKSRFIGEISHLGSGQKRKLEEGMVTPNSCK
jgi:cyclin-dependent kinase 7